jgi:hypothetical protein
MTTPLVLTQPVPGWIGYEGATAASITFAAVGALTITINGQGVAINPTGSGTLGALIHQIYSATPTPSGAGTLAAVGIGQYLSAATPSGSGTLSGTVKQNYPIAAGLAGAGSLSATVIGQYQTPAALSGVGTLSATVTQLYLMPVVLSGDGALGGGVNGSSTIPADLTGIGTLTVTSIQIYPSATAALSGTGSLSATATGLSGGAAILAGTGALSAAATPQVALTPGFAGAGTLTGPAVQQFPTTAALAGAGTLSATTLLIGAATPALASAGTLSATALQKFPTAAALAGAGTLSATAAVVPKVPTYDATGTGGSIGGSSATSFTWTHTAAAGSTVIAALMYNIGPVSIKYGSSSMTQIGSNSTDSGGNVVALYRLIGAPGGAQTVTVTCPAFMVGAGNTVSVTSVTSLGTPTNVNDGGTPTTSLSQPVTCAANQLIIQAFEDLAAAGADAGITVTGGGTRRSLVSYSTTAILSVSTAIATTTFTATLAAPQSWAGIAVVLS